jgi:DNA primase
MDLIQAVKEIPILKVAELLGIEVKRNKAMCFKGHDSKPSLSFTPAKNLFYCFGCAVGGSNIELVKQVKGVNNKDAIFWLKNNFIGQIDLPQKQRRDYSIKQKTIVESKEVPDIDLYTSIINDLQLSHRGSAYLKERGFSEDTIIKFQIKDLDYSSDLFLKLIRNYGKERLRKAGLTRLNEYQGAIKENFLWWDYVILFPFLNENKVEYIQGRRLSQEGPKYLGLRGVPKPLYNISAINHLKQNAQLLLCEGIPDVLAAYEMGYAAVGVLGAHSFNDNWTEILSPFDVVIVPDNDAAGTGFAKKVKQSFLRRGKIVQIAKVQDFKDLAEFYQKKIQDK